MKPISDAGDALKYMSGDAVNHPHHYNTGKIEVIEFIEDQNLGFHLANAVKYICRAGRKNKATRIEDLEKAIWYLRRKVELLRAKKEKREPRHPNAMAPVPAHPNCRCSLEPIPYRFKSGIPPKPVRA